MVEFSGTLDIVKPVDLQKGNRRLLYEFSNRGGRGTITGFNYGRGTNMTEPEYAGDGFLMRLGYTVMWSGWQGDLIELGQQRRRLPALCSQGGPTTAGEGPTGVQHN